MRLLGSMLTTRIFLAAMSRANLSAEALKRTAKFYFYVDEFQNFANETFSEILSESRKYNLCLTIAHQYVEQMEEEVRAAVFGNVGTTVAFRVGPFDAEVLETIFFPTFTKEDLVNLGFAQVYLTLMIDGIGSPPFSAVTLPPIEPPPRSLRTKVVERSRMTYGTTRADVEKAIYDELASTAGQAPLEPPRQQSYASRSPVPARPFDTARPPVQRSERPLPRPEPTSQQKSPEDLKSILRTMTSKVTTEKVRHEEHKQQSLKSALAGVLAKNSQQSTVNSQQQPVPTPVVEAKKPFEVPEDKLRSILKGE